MSGDNNDQAAPKHLSLELKRRHFLQKLGFIGAGTGAMLAAHILNGNSEVEATEIQASSATPMDNKTTGKIPHRPLEHRFINRESR